MTDNSFSIRFQDENGKACGSVNFTYTIADVRPPGIEINTLSVNGDAENDWYTIIDKRQAQSLMKYLENFIMTGYDTTSN